MRTFDLAPLYRSTVGFDRLFTMLDQVAGFAATQPLHQDAQDRGERLCPADACGQDSRPLDLTHDPRRRAPAIAPASRAAVGWRRPRSPWPAAVRA